MEYKTVIDYLDDFVITKKRMLEELGVQVRYQRTVSDVPNQFSKLSLRYGDNQTSVTMWESGKAVVTVKKPDTEYQKSFDDMYNEESQFGLAFDELLFNLEFPA